MATLCTLLISCNKEIDYPEIDGATQISSRSADPIAVLLQTEEGTQITTSCTKAMFDYNTTTTATVVLTFADSSTVSYQSAQTVLSVGAGLQLGITVDGGLVLGASELTVDVCSSELCYENNNGSIIGAALDFIIEDLPQGL